MNVSLYVIMIVLLNNHLIKEQISKKNLFNIKQYLSYTLNIISEYSKFFIKIVI